jgi:hypothetical protein
MSHRKRGGIYRLQQAGEDCFFRDGIPIKGHCHWKCLFFLVYSKGVTIVVVLCTKFFRIWLSVDRTRGQMDTEVR